MNKLIGYNRFSIKMYKIIAISLFLFASNIFAASVAVPTITKSVSTGTTFKFTETLSGKLPIGYKVKIDLNNGKGLVAMTCSGVTCTLSSNSLPAGVDSASYKVGIYDSKGILQGTITNGDFVINDTVDAGLVSYTKISNIGSILPDTAVLGSTVNDWACTKDNHTGLIWEVKLEGSGLRSEYNSYTNFTADYPNDPTDTSINNTSKYGATRNTDVFVRAVNKQTLCGASNWRLPTVKELMTLVYCSDEKYDIDGSCKYMYGVSSPTINEKYFPNTSIDFFWASSPVANNISSGWYVYFEYGHAGYTGKDLFKSVRLVH